MFSSLHPLAILNFKLCEELCLSLDFIECIFVELCNPNCFNGKVIIGCIYRPPGTDVSMFNLRLLEILHTVDTRKASCCVLCGDFNLDLIKFASHTPTEEFLTNLNVYSYIPLIKKPTRITESTSSL